MPEVLNLAFWIPAFAGMTNNVALLINSLVIVSEKKWGNFFKKGIDLLYFLIQNNP